jgi:cytochrome c-type biogenesis protein CcmE
MCTKCTTIAYKGMSFSVFTTFQTKREKNSFHVQLKKIKKKKKQQNKKHMGGIVKTGSVCMFKKEKAKFEVPCSIRCTTVFVTLLIFFLLTYFFAAIRAYIIP